jgi:O-antigen/teichoic acid export membrane protein
VELALSITVFFVLGVESGMGLYGARIVAAAPERIPTLVSHVMVLRVMLGLPAFALILAVSAHYRFAGLGILAVNGLAILLTPFLTQWVFQGLRQMQWVAAGTALRNFTFVALVLLLVRPGSDIRLVALAEVLGISALALFSSFCLFRRLHVRPDWTGALAGAGRLFREVWFMGLSDFTWACLWYSPALIVGWLGLGMERVAWVAASVRIVIALHTFVWLYFFNMLPNMAKELAVDVSGWRDLMTRSITTSIWPACLAAVGGTLIAPLLMPLVFGEAFGAAVRPFQIVIWMIPVAWFSDHFRFS